ncbi:MAG: hypothetical protein EOO39_08890 [Cytophagaceae bacterium]|nr:MAG: hypothetical protein EOO39_08890 [Cytophagaceae bacterium]
MGITKVPLHDGHGGYNENDSVDYWEFEVVCMLVAVWVSKLSSAPVSGTTPQEYAHTYSARAKVQGGTAPFTYDWGTTEGDIVSSSVSEDSVIIEVINTSPNDGGVSGTVICTAYDDDGCSDTNSADFGGANGPEEGPYPCTASTNEKSPASSCTGASCGCDDSSIPRHCTQVTGNNAIKG